MDKLLRSGRQDEIFKKTIRKLQELENKFQHYYNQLQSRLKDIIYSKNWKIIRALIQKCMRDDLRRLDFRKCNGTRK